MTETFGPEYVRPQNPPCPACGCCTADLCERGRASVWRCRAHVDDESLQEAVDGCPCSAEETAGTLAWRAAMVRAVTYATERPLHDDLERLMEQISAGGDGGDLADLLPKLTARRYVQLLDVEDGPRPVLTDFGRAYIWARLGGRVMADVTVRMVDRKAGTAEVLVPAFSADQPVTVLMAQVVNSRTGLTADTAPGVTLYAEVNTGALRAEHVVLTRVHHPAGEPVRVEGDR